MDNSNGIEIFPYNRLETLRDPITGLLKNDFHIELKKWAFESVIYISLNKRMNMTTESAKKETAQLVQNLANSFNLCFKYDMTPSMWKYFETPGFKKLMRSYNGITEITYKYVLEAMERIKREGNKEAKSVLDKLLRIDPHYAVLMSIDSLTSGMDTTASTFITALYHIARNPDKQQALRRELMHIMPDPRTPLTQENTKIMPYLRACIKEAQRITPSRRVIYAHCPRILCSPVIAYHAVLRCIWAIWHCVIARNIIHAIRNSYRNVGSRRAPRLVPSCVAVIPLFMRHLVWSAHLCGQAYS
ncbi:unnamed protein product [Ceratitis capitata]|uniref:(Mediterranean fruit fly) hypothetical protein n=1 Tax=Ceratitis capitata TaxID=7213 RepID=A0A811VGS0_CERCA|nr:unnamed protein product [Ceratitis capitata]